MMDAMSVFAVILTATLLPCPDCGGAVSRRAVMCPKCGCPGEAIAESAQRAEGPVRKEPDTFLRANFGDRIEAAHPVLMDGAHYAVMDFEKVVGLQTLELMFASTNAPVAYGKPQLARSVPILRLPIEETNLVFTTEIDTNVWDTIQPRDLKDRAKMMERLNLYKKETVK